MKLFFQNSCQDGINKSDNTQTYDIVKEENENSTLYSAKAIAAFSEIFIHIMFPGTFGVCIKNVSRFAVPFFFMISGYFWYAPHAEGKEYRIKLKRRTDKTIRMTIYAFALYFVLTVCVHAVKGNLTIYIEIYRNIVNWTSFLFFNHTTPFFGVGHLWYLPALLYTYTIIVIVEKKDIWKATYILIPILLSGNILMEIISFNGFLYIPEYYYRNWLFMGFPLFSAGRFLHEHESKIQKIRILPIAIIYVILLTVETIVFYDKFEFMISSFACCIIMFCFAIREPHMSFLKAIGKTHSQWIYVYHYVFIVLFNLILSDKEIPMVFQWAEPILVAIITLAFCAVTKRFNQKILSNHKQIQG